MTTAQLSFKTVPTFALTEGATSPDLGVAGTGAWAWSSTLNKPVYWNGSFWTAGGSGGSATAQSAVVSVVPAAYRQTISNVVNGAVTASSKITAWLSPNLDWDADDLEGFSVVATAKAGSVDFCVFAPGAFSGTFDISYLVG